MRFFKLCSDLLALCAYDVDADIKAFGAPSECRGLAYKYIARKAYELIVNAGYVDVGHFERALAARTSKRYAYFAFGEILSLANEHEDAHLRHNLEKGECCAGKTIQGYPRGSYYRSSSCTIVCGYCHDARDIV